MDDLAKELEVSKSTLSNYENGETLPPIDKLCQLCELFELPINSFIEEKCQDDSYFYPEQISFDLKDSRKIIEKYENTYHTYYYKTGIMANKEPEISQGTLKIHKKKGGLDYTVEADFGNNRYEGSISIIGNHTYINLKGKNHFERVLIILHDPPTINHYYGGLGVVASVSEGRRRSPCVQKVVLASIPLELKQENDFLKEKLTFGDACCVIKVDDLEDDDVYRKIKDLDMPSNP